MEQQANNTVAYVVVIKPTSKLGHLHFAIIATLLIITIVLIPFYDWTSATEICHSSKNMYTFFKKNIYKCLAGKLINTVCERSNQMPKESVQVVGKQFVVTRDGLAVTAPFFRACRET